jgi:hypothetical protein
VAEIPPRLPREPRARAALIQVIAALSAEGKYATFQEAETWIATADNGREVYGVLNLRYDLGVLECQPPAPWYLVAYDTQLQELVLAKDIPNGTRIECPVGAQYCAEASGETVDHLVCY